MATLDDPHWRLSYTLHFVRALGWQVGLDYDGELLIERPDSVSTAAIDELLQKCGPSLKESLQSAAVMASRQLVGGPLNGQKYGLAPWSGIIVRRVARARWAAYYAPGLSWKDGRAFYVGEASNIKKARALARAKGPTLFRQAAGGGPGSPGE